MTNDNNHDSSLVIAGYGTATFEAEVLDNIMEAIPTDQMARLVIEKLGITEGKARNTVRQAPRHQLAAVLASLA